MKNSEIGEVLHVSNPGDVINLNYTTIKTLDVAITLLNAFQSLITLVFVTKM